MELNNEYGNMGTHLWQVLHMASTNKLRSYDYYILELYCSPILSESDRLDYSFPPVLGFDVFWAPASRRQQNDQLGEDPELLSLALKGFLILIWCNNQRREM